MKAPVLPLRLLIVEPDAELREKYQQLYGARKEISLTIADDPDNAVRARYDLVVIGWLPDFNYEVMRTWRAGYLSGELYKLGASMMLGVTDNSTRHLEACAYGWFWRNPTQAQLEEWLPQILELMMAGHFFDLDEFRK